MKQLELICLLLLGTSFAVLGGDTIINLKLDALKDNAVVDSVSTKQAKIKGKIVQDKLFKSDSFGKAMRFRGGRYQLVVPADKDLDLVNDFTIQCVFNAFKINDYRTLLWKGDRSVAPQQINYYVSINDGKMEFKFKDAKGHWKVFSTLKPVIAAHKWYTTVITFDCGQVNIYVNNKKCIINQQKNKLEKLVVNKAPLYIGAGANGSNIAYAFDGLIKAIKISKGINPPTIKKGE